MKDRPARLRIAVLSAALLAAACSGGSSTGGPQGGGIGEVVSAQGDGAEVTFDPDALPIPIVPLPNDVLTRPDPTSSTGKRLNVPTDSDTSFEFRIRAAINQLDGFGVFQNISVAFSAPIDLDLVRANFDDDPANDNLFVLNLKPGSDRFGERVEFDLESALLPLDINGAEPQVFGFDPQTPSGDAFDPTVALAAHRGITLQNLVFPAENRFPFYEDRTNTLILRPKLPMEPNAVYGVYLTRGLRDAAGKALRSPFNPAIALFTQFADLNRGLPLLAARGVRPGDLAFAWSFTTMDLFRPMDLARDGLDGKGPLGYLPASFPPRFALFDPAQEDGSILLPPSQIQLVAALIGPVLAGSLDLANGGPFFDVIFQEFSLTDIAYVIGGAYRSPAFIGRTGLFQNEVVDGRARLDPANPADSEEVPFFLMVPTTRPRPAPCVSGPPFPVLNFIHANQTDRIIALGIAQEAAACGIAVIGIDQPAHGPLFPKPEEQLVRLIATQGGDSETAQLIIDLLPEILALINVMGLSDFPVDEPPPPELTVVEFVTEVLERADLIRDLTQQELISALTHVPIVEFIFGRGRAKIDADNDGLVENGEAFFTADLGKTRDIIRQTMVDLMQLNRLLKGLCVDRDGNGLDAFEGDFNGDGVCDVGGPENEIFMGGLSQGGLLGSVLMGIENKVRRAVVNVPGGAYLPLVQRSSLDFVVQRVFLQILGPLAVAVPYDPSAGEANAEIGLGPGQVAVAFIDKDVAATVKGLAAVNRLLPPGEVIQKIFILPAPEETDLDAAQTPGFVPPVAVENLTRDHAERGIVGPGGAFRVGIPADVGDRIRISFPTPQGPQSVEVMSVGEGLGIPRNHERFRRFQDVAQLIVDPSDAINYAQRWFKRPPAGVGPKEVLIQSDPGDTTVPVASQVALGRSAGLLSEEQAARFVAAGLVKGDETIPTEEQVPGIGERLEDFCRCQDPTGREPTCVKEDFNDIVGTGSEYRDALWAANGNRSIFTWHLSGRHEYMLAPDQKQSLAALRYTLGAQRQALSYLLEPGEYDPRISTYEPMCAMNILDFSDVESIGRSLSELDRIFEPICGGCAVRITCGDGCDTVTYMTPAAGAANAAVWMSPLALAALIRRRLRR